MASIMTTDGWKQLQRDCIPAVEEPARTTYNGESPGNTMQSWHPNYDRAKDPRFALKLLPSS